MLPTSMELREGCMARKSDGGGEEVERDSAQSVMCFRVVVESFTLCAMRKHISGFQTGKSMVWFPKSNMMTSPPTFLLYGVLRKLNKIMTMNVLREYMYDHNRHYYRHPFLGLINVGSLPK